ncbi:hypothetical protein GCM10009060_03600 [Halorubrum trapanicum]
MTAGNPERTARLGRGEVRLRGGVGLKGAAGRAKHDDARTAEASEASDEDRSESRESSRLGLWRCAPSVCRQQ